MWKRIPVERINKLISEYEPKARIILPDSELLMFVFLSVGIEEI